MYKNFRTQTENLTRIYNMSKTVKALAIIDIITSFFYLLLTPFVGFFNLIEMMFGYMGYHGAKTFDKGYIINYSIFQIFKTFLSILFPILVFINYSIPTSYIITSVIIMFLNVYISVFIHKFYKELKDLSLGDLDQLKRLNSPINLTVW